MMALAPFAGRQTAHELVYAACSHAVETEKSLFDGLVQVQDVVVPLGRERFRLLTNPANYLGSASRMVDQILQSRSRSDLEK